MIKQLYITYKETAIYSLGNLANKIVGFLLLPLYTLYIPINDFGVLGLIEPLSQITITILSLGLHSAFMRWYAVETDEQEKGKIFFNINFVLFLNTFIWILLLVFLAEPISLLLFSSTEFALILKITFTNVFFLVVNPIIFSTLRIQHKPIQYSIIRSGQLTINLLLNIYFIVYLEWGLLSIFLSQLITQVLIFLYFVPFYFKLSRLNFKQKLIREIFVFSLPLIPVGVLNLIITMINRYFLEYYDTMKSVGIFSFAFRISNTIKVIVIESLALSLTPILFEKLAKKTENRFVKKNFIYGLYVIMIVYVFMASFSQEIILLIAQNKDYYTAYQLVPILGLVYIFHAVNYFYTVLLTYSKKTTRILLATLFTAIITILLNVSLVSSFKMYGAAIVNALSTIILSVLMYYYSKENWGSYFEISKLASMIFIALLIVVINNTILTSVNLISIVSKFLVCLTFPFLLYPLKFYEQIEIDKISEFTSGILKKIRKD